MTDKGIYLNEQEWERMLQILQNPPEPNNKIKALFERGKTLFANFDDTVSDDEYHYFTQ
ncbi:MAG: DUF1778 domain-containing protein [Moraxella sp.]|nr:DUF1778 domain-containing protein [Moraxella sp.]